MIIKKNKMALALAAIGACVLTAQTANAGLVEVNLTGQIPTFSTDISGPGSNAQPFFAPDVRWSPGENIVANSSVRFNLGGITGNPAQFVTNAISVDNFVWNTTGVVANAFTNTGVATSAPVGLAGVSASYTNGDAAKWFSTAAAAAAAGVGVGPTALNRYSGTALAGSGRIFLSTTAGGLASFDVTVTVVPTLAGNATFNADSITLSLNTGKYIDPTGATTAPSKFATGPLLGSKVNISNLKVQGFDGTAPVPANPDGNGKLNMYVSVQAGGASVDVANGTNKTLIAASGNPFTMVGARGQNGVAVVVGAASPDLPATINTAATETKFSISPGAAGNWFANALDAGATVNHMGSFTFNVATALTTTTYDTFGPGTTSTAQVSDPNGNVYAITAADILNVTVTGSSATAFAPFTAAGALYLRGGQCTVAAVAGDVPLTVVNPVAPAVGNSTGTAAAATLVPGTAYNLCAVADGVKTIQTQSATATVQLNNVEPTYQDPTFPAVTLGDWTRNGCSQTFFNVPANTPGAVGVDVPFLRFTNTTNNTAAGTVRATVYGQNGVVLGTAGALLTSASAPTGLIGHQTGVYNAADIATAIGLPAVVAPAKNWTGRARVILSGGFSTCEGQNMVLTSNGTLNNLSSTTSSNSNALINGTNGNNNN